MTFLEKLSIYAELLVVHGLNVQPGQIVQLSTEPIHRQFALLIAEVAYKRGAKFVNIDLGDPRAQKLRVELATEDSLSFVPAFFTAKYNELVDETAANLRLIGMEEPDLLSDLDPKRVNTVRLHQHLAVKRFYDEGIGKSKVHWTVAAAATPAWAKKVYPELSGEEAAYSKLWDDIFAICRVDQPDCLAAWDIHNAKLHSRAKRLNQLRLATLHFKGPGTDLTVGLSPKAKFKGGSDLSPREVAFEPNVPTEEVFTTPDYRRTSGYVRATRPFLINGKLIEGLELEFTDGVISSFSASAGAETFREYISSDEGAKRLGEVALVGIDSPVYKTGRIFQEILFDENAACHIAVGSAYKFCLEGGATMSKEQLVEIGCNESTVHTDMMISSEEVDVTGTTYDGATVLLLKQGAWVGDF